MKTKMLLLSLMLVVSVLSCKKEEPLEPTPQTPANPVTPPPAGETYNSLSEFWATKKPQAETFTVLASTGGTFTTAKGSILSIPPNAFQTGNGQLVTGSVSVRLKEIFSNSDILFSGVMPVYSNYYYLDSGGEWFLRAQQSGENLRLRDGVALDLEIPAQADDADMLLFFAGLQEEPIDSVGVNWQLADSSQASASGFTFNSANNMYSLTLDSLGWGNIDRFINNPAYFSCSFDLTGVTELSGANTTAFAVFKGENSIWPLGVNGWGSIAGNLISDSHLAAIDMNIVVISVKDGQLYSGILDVTPAASQTYTVAMAPTTSADLDVAIAALP